jgi:hypothetical protein
MSDDLRSQRGEGRAVSQSEVVKFPNPAWRIAPFGSSPRKEMAKIRNWHAA